MDEGYHININFDTTISEVYQEFKSRFEFISSNDDPKLHLALGVDRRLTHTVLRLLGGLAKFSGRQVYLQHLSDVLNS